MKKKMRTLAIAMAATFVAHSGFAQNPLWSLPPAYVDQFAQPLPTGDYTGAPAQYAHNAMHDAQGNLLFFVVDGFVYDAQGNLREQLSAPSATGAGGSLFQSIPVVQGLSETLIIPHPAPGECRKYFIILSGVDVPGATISDNLPYWGLLDLDAPYLSMNMAPMMAQVNLNEWDNLTWGKLGNVFYAASDLRSDASRLVFVTVSGKIFRFRLSSAGLIYDNYSFTLPGSSIGGTYLRAEMELASLPDGTYRLAVPYEKSGATVSLLAATLDAQGNVTASQVFDLSSGSTLPAIHGLEFSPSGRYLYFTHETNTLHPNPLEFIDFQNLSAGAQPLAVPNASNYQFSQIERGTDGKLYLPGQNGSTNTANRLSTLSNSDSPTNNSTWINANWVNNALSVNYQASFRGLPSSTLSSFKSYTLPDQIDGMDYFAHFTSDLECCIANTNYHVKGDYVVTASATWQPGGNPFMAQLVDPSVLTVQQTLRIAPGATLTINNMTLKFAPGARVIIERGNATQSGGRLILNGTTLTSDNSCSDNPMWLGVEVWGNPSLAQTLTHSQSKQGRLDMNSSVIEHARIGALASRQGTGNNLDNTHNGGLIRTENSTFRHNQTDVHMRRYGNTNLSRFVNTQFLLTQALADINAWQQYRVYLLDVLGPLFEGCDFVNAAQVYAGQGTGLHSENSRFTVRARCTSVSLPCNSWDRGRVEGFRTGVYATAPAQNATRTAYIDQCDFSQNRAGILLNNQDASAVLRNQFSIPTNFTQAYGLHLNRSTGYKVEENTFSEPAPVTSQSGLTTYGIIVSESGTLHNEIYKNTFSELRVGIQAQGINAPPDLPTNSAVGLQLVCNTFNKNIYEANIAVSSGRIDHQQGVFGQFAAGNKFSLNSYTPYNDIWINPNADDINYVHFPVAVQTPVLFDPLKVGLTVYGTSNTCPSKIKVAGGPVIVLAGMLDRKAQLDAETELSEAETRERTELGSDIIRTVNHLEEFADSADHAYTLAFGAADTKEDLLAKTDYRVSKGEYTAALTELYGKMGQYGFSTDLINMRVYAESEAAGFKITEEPINWHVYWAEALANAGVEYEAEGYALLEYLKNEGAFEPEIEPLWSEPDPKKGASGNTPAIEAGKVYEVFPNPATDQLTISIEGAYRAELHSAAGGESATAILSEDGTWILPQNLAAGAYLLRVFDQNGSLLHTQTVLKQ